MHDDTPYRLSGGALVLASLALATFLLAAGDSYLLRHGSLAAVISASLIELANSDRAQNGEAPLARSATLTAVAQAKADDMAAKSYFAHTSPEGHDPWYWFTQAGYSYAYAGENLAVDFTDSVAVEEAWMRSPEHRDNVLGAHYTEVGIATAKGTFEGHPTTFVAEEFGAPAGALALDEPAAPEASRAWAPVLASPKSLLGWVYYILAALTLLVFAYMTELELHRRHLLRLAEAGGLLALMLILFSLANVLFFAHPVLAAL